MSFDFESKAVGRGFRIWSHAGIAFVTVEQDPTWPPRIVEAYERRVEASLLGRCRCGAVAEIKGVAPRQARGRMEHEDDCDATDERFAQLVSSHQPLQRGQDTIRPKKRRR